MCARSGVDPTKKQKGGDEYCTKNEFGTIHDVLHEHEKRHWNLSRPLFATANVQGAIEAVILLPGQSATSAEAIFEEAQQAYANAADAGNNAAHAVSDVYPNCQLRPL